MLRLRSLKLKCSAISVFLKFCAVLVAALLVGCVKPTKFPRYLTIADVVNNVKCQLYEAILDSTERLSGTYGNIPVHQKHWIYGWTAKFEMSIQVYRDTDLDGDTSTVVPYTLGTFTIGPSVGLRKSSTARLSFDFNADRNLEAFMSDDERCAYQPEKRRRRNLAGETGLRLWFGKLIQGMGGAGIQPNGFTYSVDFVLEADGSILPSYRFMWPSNRILSGKIIAKKSRRDTNNLKVTFGPFKADPPAFEDTALGILLQGIRDDLAGLQEQKDFAKAQAEKSTEAYDQAKADLESHQEILKTFAPLSEEARKANEARGRMLQLNLSDARRTKNADENMVINLNKRIEMKMDRATVLKQELRYKVAPISGMNAATQRNLDNQLLRDGLRDIRDLRQ